MATLHSATVAVTRLQKYTKLTAATTARAAVAVAIYPKANDLALEAVHDDNHLTWLGRRICEILAEHTHNVNIHTMGDNRHPYHFMVNWNTTNTPSQLIHSYTKHRTICGPLRQVQVMHTPFFSCILALLPFHFSHLISFLSTVFLGDLNLNAFVYKVSNLLVTEDTKMLYITIVTVTFHQYHYSLIDEERDFKFKNLSLQTWQYRKAHWSDLVWAATAMPQGLPSTESNPEVDQHTNTKTIKVRFFHSKLISR